MRIVELNNKVEQIKYKTVFGIPGDRKIIVTSSGKLKARDIRIIQLCLMLGDEQINKEIHYEDLKRNLNILYALNYNELGYLIKYFKILDFEEEELVSALNKKVLNIFGITTEERLKLFLIRKEPKGDFITELTIRRVIDAKYLPIFEKNNILTIGDVLEYSPRQLLRIKGMRKEVVEKIQKKLKMVKLSLKEDNEEEKES